MDAFSRTAMLLSHDGVKKLKRAGVAVFGIGGVGSFAAEALARSGIGRIALFDSDVVCDSNINRQLVATTKTIGLPKVDVMRSRIADINPEADVAAYQCFYDAATAVGIDLSGYDYVIDAIDTVTSKLLLIDQAQKACVPIISSMGAGNKLDPTRFEVADIFETSVCPLAKVMRKQLSARGITKLKVVYSKEPALAPLHGVCDTPCPTSMPNRRQAPGSVPFVPPVAGLILAGEVIKDIALLHIKDVAEKRS